jgi:hypothetical protein
MPRSFAFSKPSADRAADLQDMIDAVELAKQSHELDTLLVTLRNQRKTWSECLAELKAKSAVQ